MRSASLRASLQHARLLTHTYACPPCLFPSIPADDIFAATPTDVKEKEAAAAAAATAGPAVAPGAGARKGLLDNYDDAEGYYNFQVGAGEVLERQGQRRPTR